MLHDPLADPLVDPGRTAPATPRRILIVSDAWLPQVNGVVRTLATVSGELASMGHTVEVIGPDRFRTMPLPTYPEIRLAVLPARSLARMIEAFAPDALHVATEGPLGAAARAWAIRRRVKFTTSFHTRFAEYVHARTRLPLAWSYAHLRRFHNASAGTMVATESLRADLFARDFRHLLLWSRGVDLALFDPGRRFHAPDPFAGLPRPVFLNVGRVAVEKNLRAFLDLDLPGCSVVIGDGPALNELRRAYPRAHFLGAKHGADLARCYAGADVFVFPSRTDTFGLVLLEALASGTPVAAFPVPGPRDVLHDAAPGVGVLDMDLRRAALAALHCDRAAARAHAERFAWSACAKLFRNHLVPAQS